MTRRQTASIVFVVLCIVLVAAAVTLNIGWILVNGRRVAPIVLGVTTFSLIIAGLIVYTVFLVREMGITEQQDSFLNSVTHELKTPIASIRLYLETLQSRDVGDAQRKEFYRVMLQDTDRLQHTVEQVLKAGASRQKRRLEHRAPQLGAGGGLLHPPDGHPADRDPLGDLVLTGGVVRVDASCRSDEQDDERRNDEEGTSAHLPNAW